MRADRYLNAKDIAAELDMTVESVREALDELERRGLVRRERIDDQERIALKAGGAE